MAIGATRSDADARQKIFVLDTSVLMHDPQAIENFGSHEIVIPIGVISELDVHKTKPNGKGGVAREASRRLMEYRARGSLDKGVRTRAGGLVRIDIRGMRAKGSNLKLEDTPDHRIIAVAYHCMSDEKKDGGRKVILVSKDNNMILKANAFGIEAQDYESDKRIHSAEELYTGRASIELYQDPLGLAQHLYQRGWVEEGYVFENTKAIPTLFPNICCTLVLPGGQAHCYGIYKKEQKRFVHVSLKEVQKSLEKRRCKITPRNIEQAFAIRLIEDSSITFVSISGRAGTGKTLIALAATYGIQDGSNRELAIYRPHVELVKELGFLPGDLREKFQPWTYPILDNLELLVEGAPASKSLEGTDAERRAGKMGMSARETAELAVDSGQVKIYPVSHLRGRSLNHMTGIVDEAQNLTPHVVKTVVTRVGFNSRFIFTGDPFQVDDPYLDVVTNGLSHVVERLKDFEHTGHIMLQKTERSSLAELAAEVL